MKFDMGSTTLGSLTNQTQGAGTELAGLIRQLVDAAAPLEGRFNGNAKVAFDNFKAHADEITVELNQSLAGIFEGVKGMDTAFVTGDQDMHDNARTTQGAANFDAARFTRGA